MKQSIGDKMKKELKERTATINVKGENITYVEKYLVDETGEEIFDRKKFAIWVT
jgi:hypothetical protein